MTHAMRWPWERQDRTVSTSLGDVVGRLDQAVAALRLEVERLRREGGLEGGGSSGARGIEPPR